MEGAAVENASDEDDDTDFYSSSEEAFSEPHTYNEDDVLENEPRIFNLENRNQTLYRSAEISVEKACYIITINIITLT